MNHDEARPAWWRTPGGIAAIGFGLVLAFYILREHYAHAVGTLPYLILLACPLMHLLMPHHGHGAHRRRDSVSGDTATQRQPDMGAR